MNNSIQEMKRGIRRRLQRIIQKGKDANHRRRATAILMLNKRTSVSETARLVSASRTSIREWRRRYEQYGESGLVPESQGRPAETVNETMCSYLLKLIQEQPGDYGYLGSRWTSALFVHLLAEIRRRYRQTKQIILIANNYVIHKSGFTQCFLRHNRKFKIIFQSVYHPWVNKIELLWKQLHDTITRNHRYSTMKRLMNAVRIFMEIVAPFPGSQPHLAKV